MAAAKSHRYLGGAATLSPSDFADQFEFDEADVWTSTDHNHNHNHNHNHTNQSETRKSVNSNPRPLRKSARKAAGVEFAAIGARSMPVSVPDWSKILRGEYSARAGDCTDEEEEGGGNDRMPPHEYLARTRVASLSVHEGIGRTLKGRDLSRVRNAIWKQIGFED